MANELRSTVQMLPCEPVKEAEGALSPGDKL